MARGPWPGERPSPPYRRRGEEVVERLQNHFYPKPLRVNDLQRVFCIFHSFFKNFIILDLFLRGVFLFGYCCSCWVYNTIKLLKRKKELENFYTT